MIVIFDIDGVVRDVGGSYRRAIADTVAHFTNGLYRPTMEDIDQLKSEGVWNNDWKASQELIYRYFQAAGQEPSQINLNYNNLVDFFQSRYRGTDPENWNGYITTEPLLLQSKYLAQLTASGINWGFFSGATRGSAEYVLKKRLGLENPVLIAMEDAPGKPDPTGLFAAVQLLETPRANTPVIYVGDTVADIYTIVQARKIHPERLWIAVGILPPHVQLNPEVQNAYTAQLKEAGAAIIFKNVQQLTPQAISNILL
ncbi:MAG: TIGR01548 family HAD-type hydrolase [Gomphosphaeria aponina SAG 52.96 = DSM 107014]|uniref:TIGR01548 family HAD-type hydrolase n=1 Tax=Gomphosphaeria aponina SAG 52.96 = DSM 107014 TaxID=1521640 RepID=A0A941GV39_9CHRO|nr:TIGR01548 family HAD-type hydrolase [Gomphosphaeria aponina SAG 52.96 = DSM 107014]